MRARIKDDLIGAYKQHWIDDWEDFPYWEDAGFLLLADRIAGKDVDLIIDSSGDAFEARDNNYWLPASCWDEIKEPQ